MTRTIAPSAGWVPVRLPELWEYRELLYFLVWREVKVRYKQTALGVLWALLQPALTVGVFSLFFGRLAELPSDGVPYPAFALCAVLPWQLFAFTLTESSNSVVANQRLITKVYFPRLIVPLSSVGVAAIDFAIAMLLGVAVLGAFGITPGLRAVTVPLWTAYAGLVAFGAGLWLAALNVRYRDVRYVLPFMIQIWMFASPVAYSSSLVPEPWRWLYALNPMVGVIDGFRWALLGLPLPLGASAAVSIVTVLVLVVGGLLFFRRTERTFADLV